MVSIKALCAEKNILRLARACDVGLSEIARVLNISVREVIRRSGGKSAAKREELVYIIFGLLFDSHISEILTGVWSGNLEMRLESDGSYCAYYKGSDEILCKFSIRKKKSR